MSIVVRLSMLAGLIVGCAAPSGAQRFVVSAEGQAASAYPAGRKIAEDAKIVLGAQDRLVLLDRGGTHALHGPATFSGPLLRTAAVERRIAAVIGPTGRSAIAAVRGFSPARAHPPGIWRIDTGWSGTICVPREDAVSFTRHASGPTTLALTVDGSTSRTEWPAGVTSLAWPSAVSLRNGARYRLDADGASADLRLVTVDAQGADVADVASLLSENGCSDQLRELVSTATAISEASGDAP